MRKPSRTTPRQTGHRAAGLARWAIAAAMLAGCQVSKPASVPATYDRDLANGSLNTVGTVGKLINEGGTVFALPGTIKLPAGFAGDLSGLVVSAERLDGGAFSKVAPAPVAGNGTFTLQGPITSQLFFASTEFTANGQTARVRALARAQGGTPIVLDAASSLVSAKVALAAQKRSLDDLNYPETTDLTAQVRSTLGDALDTVNLAQPNEALSAQLTSLAKQNDGLSARLYKWEASIAPQPAATAASTQPSAQPTATPTPEPSHEPVK